MSRNGQFPAAHLHDTAVLHFDMVYSRRPVKHCPIVTRSQLNHDQSIITTTFPQDLWNEAHRSGAERPHLESGYHRVGSHCTAPEVDLVIIASNHRLHASQAELALEAKEYVFIEEPIALTLRDADRVIAADKAAGGDKVFIGYMRKYAAAFVDTVKEVGSQSGTYPRTFSDYRQEDSQALRTKTREDMEQALETELGVAVTDKTEMVLEFFSILGSHDLSAMRELMGMPKSVIGVSPCATTGSPFWRADNHGAMFQCPEFVVAYESGVDQVARFDASVEIFGDTKTAKVCIDTPFVKGLPTTMIVKERLPDGLYRESTTRRTYEDPFTLELREVYQLKF